MGLENVYVPDSTAVANDNDDVLVDDTDGGVVLLEANPHRKSALVINLGDSMVRITTDGTAPTATRGKPVPGGAILTLEGPQCPTDKVVGIAQNGGESSMINASEVS